MRLLMLTLAASCAVFLTGCDPSGDFVFGHYDNGGHRFLLDAWSGASGEEAQGTLKSEGILFGAVECLQIDGSEARVGLDLSPSIGLSALAIVDDNGGAEGGDTIRLSPSGLPASDLCDADLEPGPPQPGTFAVRDLVPQ